MADIVLISPRFEVSFWGMEHALPLCGKRANVPIAALPLLAALTPEGHTITLIDENVEPIDFDRCARADIVGVTGMSVQRFRMTEVLTELKARGCFTVVGGPWLTVREDYFEELADVIFVGEAEETWPRFLEDWARGQCASRYEQAARTDMARVPAPRFDLLKLDRYGFGSIQFSRGCPFQCEFCDIVVTFGRRPRVKTPAQVIEELDAIKKAGQRLVFVVDDNLIGDRKAIKAILKEVVAWQRRHNYPMSFFTEASIDLADDPELMGLLTAANFIAVFVGIESPSEQALREAGKLQNVRGGDTLVEKVRRIQDAGLEVWCGMILGFDSDDATIFDRQVAFLRQARIPFAMMGLLQAIPKTPLHERMLEEGRLDPSDRPEFLTNIRPLHMSPEELRDGYLRVMSELYDTGAYFDRAESLFLRPGFDVGYAKSCPAFLRQHRVRYAWAQAKQMLLAAGLFLRLMTCVESPGLRQEYRRRAWRFLKVHRRPGLALLYLFHLMMHYHAHTMTTAMAAGEMRPVNSF